MLKGIYFLLLKMLLYVLRMLPSVLRMLELKISIIEVILYRNFTFSLECESPFEIENKLLANTHHNFATFFKKLWGLSGGDGLSINYVVD